jgi:hypothetical protein
LIGYSGGYKQLRAGGLFPSKRVTHPLFSGNRNFPCDGERFTIPAAFMRRGIVFFGFLVSLPVVIVVWYWQLNRNQKLVSPLPDPPMLAVMTKSASDLYPTPVALPVIAATPATRLPGATTAKTPDVVAGGKTPPSSLVLGETTVSSPSGSRVTAVTPTHGVTPSPTVAPMPAGTPVPPQILDSYFTRFSSEYQVDIWLLRRLAICESGYNYLARNGPYAGMFQFSVGTWVVTRNRMVLDPNPVLRLNPEEAIRTAAYKLAKDGRGAWPNCK